MRHSRPPKFLAREHPRGMGFERFVVERDSLLVDYFRNQASAERAARLLNTGAAVVDVHAIAGCRVREVISC